MSNAWFVFDPTSRQVRRRNLELDSPTSEETVMEQSREGAVSARAYQLWEESGKGDGSHEEHWRQAEQDVGAEGLHVSARIPDAAAGSTAQVDGDRSRTESRDGNPAKLRRVPTPIVEV